MLHYVSTGSRNFGAYPVRPNVRRYWEFYAVIGGRLTPWFSDGRPEDWTASTLWLFPPAVEHGWKGEPGRPSRVAVFHFSSVPPELIELIGEVDAMHVPITRPDCELLYRLAKDLLPQFWRADRYFHLHAERALIELSLLMLERSAGRAGAMSPAADTPSPVEAAENWFRGHLARRPTLTNLARETGVSEGHLRRLFQRERGCAPKIILRRIQVEATSKLLTQTDLKLEVIAAECGFASASALCRAFKSATGRTPAEFRNTARRAT